MKKIKEQTFTLYNGVTIPSIGFGTWQVEDGKSAFDSIMYALKAGYTHIDTAYAYGNEKSIGEALKKADIKRSDVFITSKLPSHIKTYDGAIEYFNKSITDLDTDYLDLYLIHAPWPWSNVGEECTSGNIEAWKAMIDLYNAKKIRSIGVSNFSITDIKALIEATNVKPMVNQIRYFIGNTQEELTTYCMENDILVEAYSPLATGKIIENEKLQQIAKKYDVSIAKLCIRYCIERNTLPLPKSVNEGRIIDNIDVDFKISDEDMEFLNSLKHIGPVAKLRS